MVRLILRTTLLLASLGSMASVGCFGPEFRDCAVTCSAQGECPQDTTCGSDGFCYAGANLDSVILCGQRGKHDASVDGPDASGADASIGAPDASVDCSPCQLVSQCGCSTSEACDRDGTGATICRPAGAGRDGDVCNSATSCDQGYFCASNSFTQTCQRYCDDDTVCQGGGGLCQLSVTGTDQFFCTVDCNPLTSLGCPAGHGCKVGRSTFTNRDHTQCFNAGGGGQSAICNRHEDCSAGFHCADLSTKRCLKYCTNIGSTSGCPPGTSCTSVGGGSVVGSVEYGVCF